MKIGILDSGLGGHFSYLKIKEKFPDFSYEFYLDRKNAPYGTKTNEEIFELSEIGCKTLWEKGCDLILVACNTISANSLKKLQEKYSDKKILGCIIPTIELTIEKTDGNIGMIATPFTVESKKYEIEFQKINPEINFFAEESGKLVEKIEIGEEYEDETIYYLFQKIDKLLKMNIDTLILGCTHFSIFEDIIQEKYPNLKIVNSAESQAIKLGSYLQKHFTIK